MSLREKQMAERRARLLDAAERIIRETGDVEFSMRSLAANAETSPATPYNLFGSKEGLLYALLSRSLDDIMQRGLSFKSRDALEQILEAADSAVDIFVHDPNFLRPLYQFLLGVVHPVYRPQFIERSLGYWRTAMARAETAGLFGGEFELDVIAHSLMAHFMGVLDFWIHDDVSDNGFRAHVAYGTALQLLPLSRPPHTAKLRSALRAARSAMFITKQANKNAPIPIHAARQRRRG